MLIICFKQSGSDVTAAMKSIFQESERQPLFMNGDAGSEFLNQSFKNLLADYGVKYFISYGSVKAAIAERFIRTLKSHIWKYFKHFNTWNYIDNLQNFVYAYNHSKHRTIGVEPANVTLDMSFDKGVFEKGYVGTFKEDYFVIEKVKKLSYPFAYKIKEFDTGVVLNGIFYEQNLQKIKFTKNQPSKKLFVVENIISSKIINGVKFYFVN